MKNLNEKRPSGLALLPFAMFIVIYMGAGIYYQVKGMEMAFYQFPSVTAMFLAVLAAFIMFKGTINEKFDTFAKGAANVDILTMLMIYILAGAFANVAAVMGGRESTVNLGLSLVPVEFLAAGLFVISAFMGTATGSSMGTVTAVIPIAVGIAEKGGLSLTVVIGAVVGGAMFGVECKIVDPETGEDLPDEVDGEFCARGYNIMKGYYKMPEATAAAIDQDGWLHTGDLARRTPEGNFKITGRIKDMIIRGGENIYPKEIEDFIYTHPKVRDVQVIGVPDEQYGEEIMAVVILKEGETSSEEEIKTYVRDHMAKHKVPRYVTFVKEFPMNAAGKILKYKMREDAVELLKLQKAASIETA